MTLLESWQKFEANVLAEESRTCRERALGAYRLAVMDVLERVELCQSTDEIRERLHMELVQLNKSPPP